MPATCCWRPRRAACSSPASTLVGGSRCTASCGRCCSPSSTGARPSSCASSTLAQPGGSRAWTTGWPPSSTGWTPGEPAEALRLLAAISMSLFDERPRRRDRPDHRADPSAGRGCRCRLAGAVRLVPPARRPHRVPRRPGSSGGGGHPSRVLSDEAGRLGILRAVSAWLSGDWQVCIDLALAGLDRARRPRTGRPHRAVRLEPGGPWGGPGRAMVRPGRDRRAGTGGRHPSTPTGGSPTKRRARWVSHCPDSRSTALQVAAGVRHMAELAEMGTLRVELDIAEAIAARELGDRDRAEPALEALAARSAYPNSYVRVLALLELVEMRLGDGDVAGSGVAVPPGRGARPARARRRRRSRAAGQDRGAALPRSGRPRRRAALDASNRRPVLAADLRGQGPSRCRAATGRRRGRAPRRTALCPAPGRARAAAGPRGLAMSTASWPPSPWRSLSTCAAEKGMLQTVAADGEAGARAHRAGRVAGAGRLDGSPAARPAVRPGTRAGAVGARRGA